MMNKKLYERVTKGIKICVDDINRNCSKCPYHSCDCCTNALLYDCLDLIESVKKEGEV